MDKNWLQAYENIQKFIKDCEIELHILNADFTPDKNNNYTFYLESYEVSDYSVKITMPSLLIDKLRYTGEKDQNQWDYKKIYKNDSGWIWKYALITKKQLINNFEEKIDMLNEEINYYQDCISKLKGGN